MPTLFFLNNVALIKGCAIAPNVVSIYFFTCYLKALLKFKFGLIIYPILNSLIRFFVSLSQIKRLVIWNKGRQWFAPNNDSMGILLQWFHLSLTDFFGSRYQLLSCLVCRCQWRKWLLGLLWAIIFWLTDCLWQILLFYLYSFFIH